MTRKLRLLMFVLILETFLFQSNCSTVEDCEFNIIGTWEITIIVTGSATLYFTFTGTATEGTVSGLSYPDPVIGSYTVSNCTEVNYVFDYYYSGHHLVWTFTGNLSSDTSMSGTVVLNFDNGSEIHTGNWTASRL